eukprot:Skav235321  [mRNA]  locus=scaffold520:529221:529913:+ [translate_table: standard]
MYIEHKQKELKFIHITKTGGTSIELWANESGLKWGKFHSEYTVHGFHGPVWHVPFPKLRASLRHRYDWFMVVRDPIERMVSEYYCPWSGSKHLENDTKYDFNMFVQRRSRNRRWIPGQGAGHFIPMSRYLDRSSVQHILHFERLELELAQLVSSYGINFTQFPHMNEARGRRFNSSHFWPQTLRVICRIYAKDFENFNYDRGRCPDESGASSYVVITGPLMAFLLMIVGV